MGSINTIASFIQYFVWKITLSSLQCQWHTLYEAGDLVAHWLEHPTGIPKVVGSIPTWNSENLLSVSFTHCQVTMTYIINARVHSKPFHLSYISEPFLFFPQHNMTCLSVLWTMCVFQPGGQYKHLMKKFQFVLFIIKLLIPVQFWHT